MVTKKQKSEISSWTKNKYLRHGQMDHSSGGSKHEKRCLRKNKLVGKSEAVKR